MDADVEPACREIEEDHPGWHVWRAIRWDGRPGMWVASRKDPAAGSDPTIMSDSSEDLREALIEQRRNVSHGTGLHMM